MNNGELHGPGGHFLCRYLKHSGAFERRLDKAVDAQPKLC